MLLLAASACCGIGCAHLVSTSSRGGHQPKVVFLSFLLLGRWSVWASCTVSKPSRRLPLSSPSSWLPWPSSGRRGSKTRQDILAQGCAFPPDMRPAHLSAPLCHLQAMRFLFTQEELELLDSLPAEEEDGKVLRGFFSILFLDV